MTLLLGLILGACVGFIAGALYVWRRVTRYYVLLRVYGPRDLTPEVVADLAAQEREAWQ